MILHQTCQNSAFFKVLGSILLVFTLLLQSAFYRSHMHRIHSYTHI